MPFFETVVHDLSIAPALTGLCAGYEQSDWRAAALADHMLEHLPDFCLTWSECSALSDQTAVRMLRSAALRVFTTDKFKNRGEFGELLLHMILKETMHTLPAISKLYYKDSANDTVKGFDAVHVVEANGSLQLWIGEVKFYADIHAAIKAVVAELKDHLEPGYLRGEFLAITNKIDPVWPHAQKLKLLLSTSTSLDNVFDTTCVPILLTYDGPVTGSHTKHSPGYFDELTTELREIYAHFTENELPTNCQLHLFLVPLKTKQVLIEKLDEKLKAWQKI